MQSLPDNALPHSPAAAAAAAAAASTEAPLTLLHLLGSPTHVRPKDLGPAPTPHSTTTTVQLDYTPPAPTAAHPPLNPVDSVDSAQLIRMLQLKISSGELSAGALPSFFISHHPLPLYALDSLAGLVPQPAPAPAPAPAPVAPNANVDTLVAELALLRQQVSPSHLHHVTTCIT